MTATPEPAARGRGTPAGRGAGRELASVAAVCAVGGGMVLFAVGRPWVELVAHRASPLPDVTLALTRLTAPGAAEARDLLADAGRSAGAAGVTATAHPGWPLLAAAGGLLLALGGLAALARSRRWPTMSARYETPAARTGRPRTDAAVWDALDRGDDPTAGP